MAQGHAGVQGQVMFADSTRRPSRAAAQGLHCHVVAGCGWSAVGGIIPLAVSQRPALPSVPCFGEAVAV